MVDANQAIIWANEAALRMHGVDDLSGLGKDVDDYRERSSCGIATSIDWEKAIIRSTASLLEKPLMRSSWKSSREMRRSRDGSTRSAALSSPMGTAILTFSCLSSRMCRCVSRRSSALNRHSTSILRLPSSCGWPTSAM
ncbi:MULTISPECIES: PAS domain-containing protein [unclassified Sphingobium]|uniref:PAS domain-containing protein n=1 Tax=unclassified Sphingobium TaxID=2611147 RepID=UPI001E4121EA|nr:MULTISPECIES: hypothetical protein [unclassified Sphingobium]